MYELFFTLVCNTWKLFYCVKEKNIFGILEVSD